MLKEVPAEPPRAADAARTATLDETAERSEERWLFPREVADLFHVSTRTLRYWAAAGKIDSRRTLGRHRRYRESDVRALLGELTEAAA